MKTLNELRDEIHENAVKRGFYEEEDKINKWVLNSRVAIGHALFAQKIALIHSELSEVLEADRKEKHADMKGWADFEKRCPEIEFSKENHAAIFRSNFQGKIKDTVENELADVVMRTLDLCAYLEIDIERHVELKMKYNELREYKHGKIIEQ